MQMKARNEEHGVLVADGESISFRRGNCRWTVPLSSILAIGEATNDSGPWGDDWFVCIVTHSEGLWYEAPAYSLGVKEVLEW